MPIIPFRPLHNLGGFFDDDDWFLPSKLSEWPGAPAMDIYETDKEVVAELNLPGIDPEKVDVEVEDGVLRVSGKSEETKEEKDKKGYYRKEISRGSFERAVRLPKPVKEDLAEAKYQDGVLKIVIPKAEPKPAKEKKIKVKVKKS